ncbi:MAG: hypothetical protein QXO59_07165 [Candidatus Jordarchaeales archaeon]
MGAPERIGGPESSFNTESFMLPVDDRFYRCYFLHQPLISTVPLKRSEEGVYVRSRGLEV